MSSVEELVTVYKLVDQYTDKANRIAMSTEALGAKIESLMAATTRLGFALAGAAVGGVVALGAEAIKASADFQQLRITLESITGSAEMADKKLAFIRALSLPATNTFSELAEAGVQLEAFGLRAERSLPILAKLAAAFKSNPQALKEGVRQFGELAAGQFPGIRQLSELGLSKAGLEKEGLKFDPNGKLLSSTKEAFEAIERYVQDKFGTILDKMSSTANAKLTTLKSKFQELMIRIGDAAAKYVLPVMDKMIAFLDKLQADKGFDKFLQRLGQNFIKFILVIAQALSFLELALAAIRFALKDVAGGVMSLAASIAITLGAAAFAKNASKFLKGLKIGNDGDGPPVPKDDGDFSSDPNGFPNKAEVETADNTKEIVKNTADFTAMLRRYVVGGGPLAGIGVTPTELAAGKGRGSSGGLVQVNVGSRNLSVAITEIVEHTIQEMGRQGIFR